MQAVLDGVAMGTPQRAEVENPAVVENNQLSGTGNTCGRRMSIGGNACD